MLTGYYGYYVVAGILSLLGMFVSNRLKSKFAKYSKVPVQSGMSGKDIAEEMLRHYGIDGVQVLPSKGFLSDHYNPANRTVNLSPDVYNGRSVSAAAVAAHECGHAVQHATAYSMLQLRSGLVPIVKAASSMQQWVLIGAFLLYNMMPSLMLIAVGVFAITALFSFITLPVEFDASKRALAWLDESGFMGGAEHDGAKDALWWAAMTYVAAALSALVMVLYLLLRYTSRN